MKKTLKTIESGDYGWVFVIEGRYKGNIGYYDDDDRNAIIYLDQWHTGRYVEIKYEYLVPIKNMKNFIPELFNEKVYGKKIPEIKNILGIE